jgi:hypothetical protein
MTTETYPSLTEAEQANLRSLEIETAKQVINDIIAAGRSLSDKDHQVIAFLGREVINKA